VTCDFVLGDKLIAKGVSPCFFEDFSYYLNNFSTDYERRDWYNKGSRTLDVECTVKEARVIDIADEEICGKYWNENLEDSGYGGIFDFRKQTQTTIFWYEESPMLRFLTEYSWFFIPVQVLADTAFSLSFIIDEFYPCTGFFAYITSSALSNLWLWSDALYDTSEGKDASAIMNMFRNWFLIFYGDFDCKY